MSRWFTTPRRLTRRIGVGLVLALSIAPGPARGDEPALPDDALGRPTAPVLLLTRPDVRADLKLRPDQAAQVESIVSTLYMRAAALKGKDGPAAVAERGAIDEEQMRWLKTHLTPDQFLRINQIELQWEGASALVRRLRLADALRLSPAQRSDLTAAVARRDRDRLAPDHDPRAAEAVLAQQALGILNPVQQAQWHQALGAPFAIQPVANTPHRAPPATARAPSTAIKPGSPAPR